MNAEDKAKLLTLLYSIRDNHAQHHRLISHIDTQILGHLARLNTTLDTISDSLSQLENKT